MGNSSPTHPWDIVVDRRSPIGNPFVLAGEENRNKVCDQYEDWFVSTVINDKRCMKYLDDMKQVYEKFGKLRLFCWCVPKRCHAETIKEFLLKG